MDQLRLRATSPMKTRAKPKRTSLRAQKNAMQMNMDETTSPSPQMRGSERGYFSRSRVLRRAPRGTPSMPETMVTAPKINDTLHGTKQRQKER